MRSATESLISQAAEDWIQGDEPEEIARKYNRSIRTVYNWMNEKQWTTIVTGRERQKREPKVPYDAHLPELSEIKKTAQRWVELGKPTIDQLPYKIYVSREKLQTWVKLPFWDIAVRYAEYEVLRKKNREKVGPRFPYDLLKQAVFLSLAGWHSSEIGPAIGRKQSTIESWKKIPVWKDLQQEVFLVKIELHLQYKSMPIQELFEKFSESQGICRSLSLPLGENIRISKYNTAPYSSQKKDSGSIRNRETRICIYLAAEDWIQGDTIKEIAQTYNRETRTIYAWKKTQAWATAVAGRKRQKRKSPVRYYLYSDLLSLETTAQQWVELGKPTLSILSQRSRVPVKQLEHWMRSRFWQPAVRYATHLQTHMDNKKKVPQTVGPKCPYYLLKQAVFLGLSGWENAEIQLAIGRSRETLKDWQKTEAWDEMHNEILSDTLMKHILDNEKTLQEISEIICISE